MITQETINQEYPFALEVLTVIVSDMGYDSHRISSYLKQEGIEEVHKSLIYLENQDLVTFKRAFGGSEAMFYDIKYTKAGYNLVHGYSRITPTLSNTYNIHQNGHGNNAGIATHQGSVSNVGTLASVHSSIEKFLADYAQELNTEELRLIQSAKEVSALDVKKSLLENAQAHIKERGVPFTHLIASLAVIISTITALT